MGLLVDKAKPMARAARAGDAFSPPVPVADVRPASDNNRNTTGTAQRGNRIFSLNNQTCTARKLGLKIGWHLCTFAFYDFTNDRELY